MKRKRKSGRKKVSSKVLAALARGRKKLAAMHKGKKRKSPGRRRKIARRIPERLESIVIEGGSGMAGRKKKSHRRKARRMSGEFFGRTKRRRRARRMSGEFFGRKKRRSIRRYHGEKTKGIIGAVTNAAMIAGGGMAGAFAAKYIPVKNAKIKAALPLIMGIGLSMIKIGRKAPFDKLALGMSVIGVLSLAKAFVPSLPTMAGEDLDMPYLPSPEEAAILGLDDDQYATAHADYYGASFEGEGDIEALQAENFATAADM
jgi:hypothetical protein